METNGQGLKSVPKYAPNGSRYETVTLYGRQIRMSNRVFYALHPDRGKGHVPQSWEELEEWFRNGRLRRIKNFGRKGMEEIGQLLGIVPDMTICPYCRGSGRRPVLPK